jgi:osmotically-inducible protein OsmY
MKVVIGVLGVLAICAAAPLSLHAAGAQAAAVKPAPQGIEKRIERKIHSDASLKKYDVKVAVVGDVATLTGTVATEADRTKAGRLAMVPGISRVDNQLVVDLNAGTKGTVGTIEKKTKDAAEKTKEGAAKVGEKTKEGASKATEKTKEGLSKTGEVITDAWITTRVKSKFIGEDLLKDSNINVDTNDHVVTLTGTVMSAAARARAVEQAKEVEGVQRVVDRLTIGPKKP